jgi:hypothetical protein
VKGTRLIAASSTAAMRETLAAETSGSTLAASDSWKDFERILPASRPGVLFVDVPRLAALGYETVQSGLIGRRGGRFDFDVNRLPTAAVLMKYLAPGGLTIASDEETISLEASTPAGLASIAAAVYGFERFMRELGGARPGPGRAPARAPAKARSGEDPDRF